jgi:hypothetical protein
VGKNFGRHHGLHVLARAPARVHRIARRTAFTHRQAPSQPLACRAVVASTLDLHAFRVLLADATGRAPEEVSQLTSNDVEFVPNGVRLTPVKKRAQRRYYRSFTTSPSTRRST